MRVVRFLPLALAVLAAMWLLLEEAHFRAHSVQSVLTSSSEIKDASIESKMASLIAMQYLVDPRIGSALDGHVWVGATVPNGMVKVGIDTDHSEVGYSTYGKVYGLSHTHVSGTGGGRSYQNMVVSPHWSVDSRLPPLSSVLSSTRSNEIAGAGFYHVTLDEVALNISLTASNKVGVHKWSFAPPEHAANASSATFHVFFRLAHDSMLFNAAEVKFVSLSRIVLSGAFNDPWTSGLGLAPQRGNYKVHACVDFESAQPSGYGVWGQSSILGYDTIERSKVEVDLDKAAQFAFTNSNDTGSFGVSSSGFGNGGKSMGAYLSYTFENPQPHDAKEVEFRLGLSYLSQEKACSNLDEMKPESFDSIRKQASQLWEEMVAGSIKVSGPLEDSDMKLLYSNLYRVFLMPVDKTGENPDWPEKDRNEKPYFDDFYCIWDTFRTLNPLLTLIAPSLEAKMLNSLIVTAQNMGGLLGDSLNGNNWGIVQSGSNADILFSEALQKGIPGVDYNSAFELLLRQMDTDPEDFLFQGRGDMKSWKTIGYIPAVSTSGVGSHFRRSSGSRTVEYAYGDFAIAQMARILGQYKNETTFLQRSNNWENLWDDSRSSHGFTGFLVPKYQGEFIDLDPAYGCIPQRGGNAEFYEDCSWTYSFYAPHNMSRVIQKVGGDDAFIKRVDAFFDLGIYNPGNEPGFLVPFLYHYVGRPDLSVARSINITDHLFLPVPEGLPGNDDAGTMAALHIFWSLGLFPIAGQDIYLILSPVFAQSQIRLGIESNKYLHLIARNLTTENRQVLSATLNGQPLTRAWIRDKEIRNGATIVLNMGSTWTGWGQKHRPPSY